MTYTQDCSRYGRVWHTAFYNKWDGQMTVVGTDKTHNITGGDYNQWKENQVDLFSFLGKNKPHLTRLDRPRDPQR